MMHPFTTLLTCLVLTFFTPLSAATKVEVFLLADILTILEYQYLSYPQENIDLIGQSRKGVNGVTDTLPDGRYIWDLTAHEQYLIYGDAMESETERYWRLQEAKAAGLDEFVLTWKERLYLLGHRASLALPSSKILSGATAADDIATHGDEAAQQLIRLKHAAPQTGESFGFLIENGKIALAGRAVTHGRFDFIITKNGRLSIGYGHHTLSEGAQEVLAAGQIKIYNGQVTSINNWSGHYQPAVEIAKDFPNLLQQVGLNVSGARLQLYNQEGVLIQTIRLP